MRHTSIVLVLVLGLNGPALAQECEPSTTVPDLQGPACFVEGAPCFYVDENHCHAAGECIFSIWVYQESNGIPGLQRGDEVHDDTCGGQIEADTIIF